jgi:hypothetical protein
MEESLMSSIKGIEPKINTSVKFLARKRGASIFTDS